MKATVKQNRWGNWRGYVGGKFVREFAQHQGQLIAGAPQGPGACGGSTEMPDEAKQWLASMKQIGINQAIDNVISKARELQAEAGGSDSSYREAAQNELDRAVLELKKLI